MEKQQITDKAFSAPIFATARIFNIDETKAASFFIFFLAFVLEPLSIGLAVAVSVVWLPVSQESVISDTTQTDLSSNDLRLSQGDAIETNSINKDSFGTETTDPFVASIIRLIDSNGGFSGTMTELLGVLNNTGQHGFAGKNGWPEDAHSLGKRLKSLEQLLLKQGISVTKSRTQERRKVEIGRIESI